MPFQHILSSFDGGHLENEVKMRSYQKNNIRNEFLVPKLPQIDVLHELVGDFVQKFDLPDFARRPF